MSSTVLNRTLVGAALVLAACATPAATAPLSCETGAHEAALLKQAPSGARRLSTHVLQVRFKGGRRQFPDKPPHGPLSGLHWRYCGYDAEAKAHLIGMSKDSRFSGKLLFEIGGKLIGAGHTVLFSPDRQEFLAVEQEDGMDGELWSIYDTWAKPLWSGYAGTVTKINGVDSVETTFDTPEWNAQSHLSARYACTESTLKGTVAFSKDSGKWTWLGMSRCHD